MTVVRVYKDHKGEWRWKAQAGNGRVTGASEEGYKSRWYATWKAKRANPGAEMVVVKK